MKKIKYIFIFAIGVSCHAQSPIVNILDDTSSAITNTYYKDVNNLLNQFEGTYLYTNGNTSLKIVLIKKIQQFNGRYYEDLIIGEYQYIKDGIEKGNTLSEISSIYNNQRVHNIDGNSIQDNNARIWKCPQCSTGTKLLVTGIRDALSDRFAYLSIRKTIVGNQEAINIKISQVVNAVHIQGTPEPASFSLPLGEYTLIKL